MPKRETYGLDFEIRGKQFDALWPLRDIISTLDDFQIIVDKAFHFSYNLPQRVIKNSLVINAQSFGRGSFQAKLELIMSVMQLTTFVTLSQVTPKDAWGLVKDGYTFLKALYNARNSGIEPKLLIQQALESGVNVIGQSIIVNNYSIPNFAEASEQKYKRLARKVDGENISLISALDVEKEGFSFSPEDRALFNPKTSIARDPVDAMVKIFQFNVESLTGRLHVIESDHVPTRDYSFTLQNPSNKKDFVHALLGPPMQVTALKEVEVRASGAEHISRLFVYYNEPLHIQTGF